MKSRFSYILILLAGLAASACDDFMHTGQVAEGWGDCMKFSASNSMMVTKSGLEYENFDIDTRYRLYGVEAAAEYDWENAALKGTECHETDDHLIYYGEDLHFRGKTYDFYGATVCSDKEYPDDINLGEIGKGPVICLNLEDAGDRLEDLMYSNNLKNCTRSSGLLQMNFIHALSKIRIEVAKQNDSEELRYARIHTLKLKQSHKSGLLDVVMGTWSVLEPGDDRMFYDDDPIALSASASMVTDASGNDAEMLIFPNEDSRLISLEIGYSLDEAGTDIKSAVCPIYSPGTTDAAFMFKQNHRYTLSAIIANDGIQIVTVLPTVYEWTDVTVDHYLGQPAYIGGLMWMDRNLGAVSADYENDWYGTVGHYFQFGRNVPYILDIEKFKEYTGDGGSHENSEIKRINFTQMDESIYVMYYNDTNTWATGDGATNLMKAINVMARSGHYRVHNQLWDGFSAEKKTELIMNAVECIYTYDHKAEHVYGSHYVKPSDTRELIKFPNDYDESLTDSEIRELYRFGYGSKNPGNTTLNNPTNWTFHNNCGREYWIAPNYNQDPCPKGWRLPTVEDVYTILPREQMSWNSNKYPTHHKSTNEEIRYGYYNDKENHICYIMKNPGTEKAYRLRIMSHMEKSGNKRYFSVSRYGVSEEDMVPNNSSDYRYLDKYLDGSAPDGTNKESTMWSNPIETIYFPACGFIVPDMAQVNSSGTLTQAARIDLRSFGKGTVLRTSDANSYDYAGTIDGFDAFSYVQYMSTTDYQLGVQANSRRSLGNQIRCVRDITAEDQ